MRPFPFSTTEAIFLEIISFLEFGSELALNWQCFAISLAFYMCYDIHAPSSVTVLTSKFHIFLLSHFGLFQSGTILYTHQFQEVVRIPTQNLFIEEATALLAEISMYPGILEEQLLRLHPKNEDHILQLLRYLQKHNRIKRDYRGSYYAISNNVTPNREAVIRRVWVLLDFMPEVEYHTASDYPVAISFFIRGKEYQIIHATPGDEALLCSVITHHKDNCAKRLVLVDTPEQIPLLTFSGIIGYCTATTDGQVSYYKLR